MITRFQVKNYKALRDVTVDLTPLHVLIGPNDAGKTSFLEAVFALCASVDDPTVAAFPGPWQGSELVWRQERTLLVSILVEVEEAGRRLSYELQCSFSSDGRTVQFSRKPDPGGRNQLHDALSGVHIYRWHPRYMRLPVVHGTEPLFRMDSSGFGLVRCLSDILDEDRERFAHLEARFREFFPQIASLRLRREAALHLGRNQWDLPSFSGGLP